MRKTFSFLFVCTTLLMLISCAPSSKTEYLEDFSEFIEEVANNHDSYTDSKWEKVSAKYEKFSGEWYDKFEPEFALKDYVKVNTLRAKWIFYKGLNETAGSAKIITDELKGIKEQVQQYLDNDMEKDLKQLYKDAEKAGPEAEKAIRDVFKELGIDF